MIRLFGKFSVMTCHALFVKCVTSGCCSSKLTNFGNSFHHSFHFTRLMMVQVILSREGHALRELCLARIPLCFFFFFLILSNEDIRIILL